MGGDEHNFRLAKPAVILRQGKEKVQMSIR